MAGGNKCAWDGQDYDPTTSDAHDKEAYCCRDCELKDTGMDDGNAKRARLQASRWKSE